MSSSPFRIPLPRRTARLTAALVSKAQYFMRRFGKSEWQAMHSAAKWALSFAESTGAWEGLTEEEFVEAQRLAWRVIRGEVSLDDVL